MADARAGIRDAEEEARNVAGGAHAVFDPHPIFDELRSRGDVHEGGLHTYFDLPRLQNLPAVEREFNVVGYDTTEAMFRDHESYSSDVYGRTMKTWGANILFMDEPDHRRYRALAQPAFALKTMTSWQDRWLRPILTDLLAALPDEGPTDLYHHYCALFPVRTIASAFGIAPREAERYHEWVLHMQGGGTPEQAGLAAKAIADSLKPIIDDRRASGATDDVIGLLAASEVEDDGATHQLTDAEILGFANLMLTAGAGTTYRTAGFLLRELIARPELVAAVREDRTLIDRLVEETLRWSPPVYFFSRIAVRDTEVDGVDIPTGALINLIVGAANHDARRWDDPHTWDPFRESKPHLAFGSGPHFCLGNQLARMELRLAVEILLDRFDSIELDSTEPYPESSGLMFRQMDGLPVVVG